MEIRIMPVSLSSLYAPTAAAIVTAGNTAGWNLGAGQLELISEYKTTTKTNSITISSIPQTYRNLIIDWNGLDTLGVGSHNIRLRMNNDTNSNHSESGWMNNAAGTTVPINYGISGDGFFIGQVPNVTGGQQSHGRITMENYTSTDAKIGHGNTTYYSAQDITKVWNRLSFRTGSTTNPITSVTFIAGAGNNLGMADNNSSGIRIYGVK
jgi:hypothetical protein